MDRANPGGGKRVLRHERRKVPERVGRLDPELFDAVVYHMIRWTPPVTRIISDMCADTIHLTWIVGGPTPERPFLTLVTAGMSSAPMLCADVEDGRPWWGELYMLLPPDWSFDAPPAQEGSESWVLNLTAYLARLPHLCDTILWAGHTFEYADTPGTLYEGVPFSGVVLAESDLLPEGFHSLPMRPGKEVRFHCVLPVHEGELRFAQEEGVNALGDRLNRAGVSDVVDCSRTSTIP